MSELNEVVTWLVYAVAAVVMLSAAASAVVFGLALRVAAEFLRELVEDREGHSDPRRIEDGAGPLAEGRKEIRPSP